MAWETPNYSGLRDSLRFKGSISTNSDFPEIDEVRLGWMYILDADTIDDDATKTNTGQSFLTGDEIVWNGTNWSLLGADAIWGDDGTDVSTVNSRNVNLGVNKLKDDFVTGGVNLGETEATTLSSYNGKSSLVGVLNRLISENTSTLNLYIDPVSGDDANDGSSGNPVETFDRISELIPKRLYANVSIYLASGTYTLTDQLSSYFKDIHLGSSNLYIQPNTGDEWTVTDSGTFTTTSGYFKHVDSTKSWTVNELRGKFIRRVSDDQLFAISGNTATEIYHAGDATYFDSTITDYEIVEHNVIIDSSSYPDWGTQGMSCYPTFFNNITITGLESIEQESGPNSGIIFNNCYITSTDSFYASGDFEYIRFWICVIEAPTYVYPVCRGLNVLNSSAIISNGGLYCLYSTDFNDSIIESEDGTQKNQPAVIMFPNSYSQKAYSYDNMVRNYKYGFKFSDDFGNAIPNITLADQFQWDNVDFGFYLQPGNMIIDDPLYSIYDLDIANLNTGLVTFDGTNEPDYYLDVENNINSLAIAPDDKKLSVAYDTPPVTKTDDYVITDTDKLRTILVDASGGDVDIQLPTASDNNGRVINIKLVDNNSETYSLTITPEGSETLDGATNASPLEVTTLYTNIRVQSDGSNWWII